MRSPFFHSRQRGAKWHFLSTLIIVVFAALFSEGRSIQAQTFDSGSNGSDGALNLTTPGTIDFDPRTFDPPLDPDGDNVYHFTTINIATGVTVRLSGQKLTRPVFWLATGAVQIDGTIDLNGGDGHPANDPNPANRRSSVPGAGGYPGGIGEAGTSPAQSGLGPGGGGTVDLTGGEGRGGGAGHVIPGQSWEGPAAEEVSPRAKLQTRLAVVPEVVLC
jgi:hypothetical protein